MLNEVKSRTAGTNQIYPCLWFDGQAKAAAEFYCSIFSNSKITDQNPMVVKWELNGKQFMGLNGGPQFKTNEAISFVIECETQKEIDHYWNSLIAGGGEESQCGWCKDQFGVSWQVVPSILGKLMSDPEKGKRVVAAFMQMKKFDIETLINA
jgi:predicted 3-demethylubiquinone-9 3-methyltransferase (glyoxalase superfamily)